jgi:hypothetical protein
MYQKGQRIKAIYKSKKHQKGSRPDEPRVFMGEIVEVYPKFIRCWNGKWHETFWTDNDKRNWEIVVLKEAAV